jgi:hypothetical protein
MKPRLLTTFVLLLAASCPLHAEEPAAGAKQTFPVTWKVGKKYTQTMTMHQEMDMFGQGGVTTDMRMELSMLPSAGAKEGTTEVKMTYEKATMSGKQGDTELPMDEALKGVLGKSVTVTYDAGGQIIDTKGIEALAGDNPMAAQLVNKDSMKQMMSQGTLMGRPKQPVGPGESWEFAAEFPSPMLNMTIKGKYTYEKDEEVNGAKCARLKFEGDLSVQAMNQEADPNAAPGVAEGAAALKALGMKITEGKISGVCFYDLQLGNVSKADMGMTMAMSMQNPENQEEMRMSVKSKVANLLKMEDAK